MVNETNLVLPSETVEVKTSNKSEYVLHISPSANHAIPNKHDITSLVVVNPPEYLEKIVLLIGNIKTMTFEREDFNQGQNLFPNGFFLSKSVYMRNDIVFHYSKEYVQAHETRVLQDEYKEEVIISDSEEEFYDGCDYYYGYRVTRNSKPTGKQIEVVTQGADVIVPELHFIVAPGDADFNSSFKQPFWEKIQVNPSSEEEKKYIGRLVNKYKFHTMDGTPVEDAIATGKPFYGKVENVLYYNDGLAGKMITF